MRASLRSVAMRCFCRKGRSACRANRGEGSLCGSLCDRRGRLKECPVVRLEPLYRIRFTYPEGWAIGLGGDWEQHFYIAEGRCEGVISGRFRGANYPHRRGDGTFRPDLRAVIETDDGATVMFE